jgi:hypothetical protein
MGGILRGLKIIRLIMTPNQNEYVPVPLLHCRICNVLVRIRIRNPNPDPIRIRHKKAKYDKGKGKDDFYKYLLIG